MSEEPAGVTETTLHLHGHHFVTGRRATARYEHADGKTRWVDSTEFKHSHWAGAQPHLHPDTGPAYFDIDSRGRRGMSRRIRLTKRPTGEQLPWVAPELRHTHFAVIFSDEGYTAEVARSTGASREEWEAARDQFKAEAEAQAAREVEALPFAAAVIVTKFGMEPILIYEDHRNDPRPEPPRRPTMDEEIAADLEAIAR